MKEYFKFRDPFDKSPHKFEIGNPIKFDRKKGDNFFFKKFFSLEFEEYAEYYQFHLDWFVLNNDNTEKDFFTHVLDAGVPLKVATRLILSGFELLKSRIGFIGRFV